MQRGLFEDYVANFWCVSSLIFKWKKHLAGSVLAKLCALATIFFSLPALLMQATKPNKDTFILCLANTSLTFFIFSYQVHEKSILIPLIPLSMLLGHGGKAASINVFIISLMTMYPLLKKDGLMIVYWAMQLLIVSIQCIADKEIIMNQVGSKNIVSLIVGSILSPVLALGGLCLVHMFCYFIQPWSSKEYLSDAVIMLAGFGYILAQLLITNIQQFLLWRSPNLPDEAIPSLHLTQ